jgi:alanine racemase
VSARMDANGQGSQLLISRTALLRNVRLLRRQLAPGTRLCAVIKADAYGLGAHLVADTLTNFSCDDLEAPAVYALAVATVPEALALTPCPVPLHILRPVEPGAAQREDLAQAIRCGHSLTVISVPAAREVARIAAAAGERALVHIMLDTGMCREGCTLEQLPPLAAAIAGLPTLRLAGLGTHYATSEERNGSFAMEQTRRFRAATEPIVARDRSILRHAANSGAVFFHPRGHLDMVRPGLSVYGIDPTGAPSIDRPLRPAMRWTAPLLLVREVRAGQTIGYNRSFTALRDMRVGRVPVGYADGYCRAFSNSGVMLVRGRGAPVVGRVSMDYTTVDVTHIPEARAGDTAVVLDDDPLSPASIYRLAEAAQTIPYELLTRIGSRITRVGVEPAEQPAAAGASQAA